MARRTSGGAGKDDAGKMERVAEGIYRRNGVYIVPIWNPGKGQAGGKDWHSLPSGSTLADARALKREKEAEKRNGRASRKQVTVGEWAGRFEAGEWVPGNWLVLRPRKAESTNLHNDAQVRHLARAFADRPLSSITEEDAAGYAVDHPGTLKEVHALFNDACKMKYIETNPFAGVRSLNSRGRKDIVVLTDSELDQLCAIARAVHHGAYGALYSAMVQTAAWTGLRPGELFRLALEPGDDVNFADVREGVIHVDWQMNSKTNRVERPKMESIREVVLLPEAEAALRSVREWEAGRPVFLTKRGKAFNQRTHYYYWDPVRAAFEAALPAGHHIRKRIAEKGQNGGLDFYELRHFFGTKLAHPPVGVEPARAQDIAKMMGHADKGQLAMQVYVHTEGKDALDRVGKAWKRAS